MWQRGWEFTKNERTPSLKDVKLRIQSQDLIVVTFPGNIRTHKLECQFRPFTGSGGGLFARKIMPSASVRNDLQAAHKRLEVF
jgi:hypothetical protein